VGTFARLNERYLLVTDGGATKGILHYRDLFKPIGLVGFFSLVQELESAAMNLCLEFPQQCLEALSEGRVQSAYITLANRLKTRSLRETDLDLRPLAELLIESTMFIDKRKMINKCKLLVDFSGTKVDSIFSRAERLRNACAHPTRPDYIAQLMDPPSLGEFVEDSRRLIDSIRLVSHRRPA
jgi:hypothetical protein